MIESIIEWSIRNRYLVILGYVLLGIAGVRAHAHDAASMRFRTSRKTR